MDDKELSEREQEAQQLLNIVGSLKKDSEFFINEAKKKDDAFSLEKPDDELSNQEKEISWHAKVNSVLDQFLAWNLQDQRKNDEILELKEELKNKNLELINLKTDFVAQKTVLIDQISLLTETVNKNLEAFVAFRNKTENDILELQAASGEYSVHAGLHSTPNYHHLQNVKLKPPNFSGSSTDKPMQFLSELKKYLEVMNLSETSLLPILQQCFTKNASKWLYTVEHHIDDYMDFESAFLERYWNEPIKSSLRTKLETERWTPEKKISRVEYAQDIIALFKELEMNLTEKEKMIVIARHFDDDISRTIRLQGIQTAGTLYDLLQDYDKRDEKKQDQNKKSQNVPKEGFQPFQKKGGFTKPFFNHTKQLDSEQKNSIQSEKKPDDVTKKHDFRDKSNKNGQEKSFKERMPFSKPKEVFSLQLMNDQIQSAIQNAMKQVNLGASTSGQTPNEKDPKNS